MWWLMEMERLCVLGSMVWPESLSVASSSRFAIIGEGDTWKWKWELQCVYILDKLDKRRKTDWGQLALKGFLSSKKEHLLTHFHRICRRERRLMALFCIKNHLFNTSMSKLNMTQWSLQVSNLLASFIKNLIFNERNF